MSVVLQLTPQDPLVARDGRPFGAGQGNRMRGLPWPLPSVVAGSFRTALVKSNPAWDFSWQKFTQDALLKISVAGVFPVHGGELYLPAPNDAVAEPNENGMGIKCLHRVVPQPITGGCDLPEDGLRPVMLSESQAGEDFKPAEVPTWWPVGKYAEWLLGNDVCFDSTFLNSPATEYRDHVSLDADLGAAAERQIFTTAGLNVTRMPRFGVDGSRPLHERFAEINLSGRITIPDSETALTIGEQFSIWHPLGGERRMVHWQKDVAVTTGWNCPAGIRSELATTKKVRLVLATPAIFQSGWKPDLDNGPLKDFKLQLVGVCNHRWKAVSGWSLAPPRGPKPIRRMVPAGSVYFFTCEPGAAKQLSDLWLHSVSDDPQKRRDGFGLALWGTW